jgi:hypothetical protein
MPICKCHSFAPLEAQTLPILSHADIAELVLLSALELMPLTRQRTDDELKEIHNKIMTMQGNFLRRIGERICRYKEEISAQSLKSAREWNRYE